MVLSIIAVVAALYAPGQRTDPYKNFHFQLRFATQAAAGFNKMTQAAGYLNLERGVTHDRSFETWATARNVRRDVFIDVMNEAGSVQSTLVCRGSWVSEFQAIPNLDAGANAMTIEAIKINFSPKIRPFTAPRFIRR